MAKRIETEYTKMTSGSLAAAILLPAGLLLQQQYSIIDEATFLIQNLEYQSLIAAFYQSSLLPFLIFLYFISFRGNKTPDLALFGWKFILVFFTSTIVGQIVSKGKYGRSMVEVDWLHGGSEALLGASNVLIYIGFHNATKTRTKEGDGHQALLPSKIFKTKVFAFCVAAAFFSACVLGPRFGTSAHGTFLLGLGNLPNNLVKKLPWVRTFSFSVD